MVSPCLCDHSTAPVNIEQREPGEKALSHPTAARPCCKFHHSRADSTFLLTAVLYFLLQVSFLVDEGVSPVLLQLLSCALCGSKVLAALAASTGSSSVASSSAPPAASSGQATTQSKSSTKKSKKEEKEKEKEGEALCWVLTSEHVYHCSC